MRFRIPKRFALVGLAGLVAAGLAAGGAVAYAGDSAEVTTPDATVNMGYLVGRGECNGTFTVYSSPPFGVLGGQAKGPWKIWANFIPYESATCGGSVIWVNSLTGPSIDGVPQRGGPVAAKASDAPEGFGVGMDSWTPVDGAPRGPDQPVDNAGFVLCEAGHSATYDSTEGARYEPDYCTLYTFYYV